MTETLARFDFRRIAADPTGYYRDRWDMAVPLSVLAATEAEARAKAATISGDPPQASVWRFRLDRVAELDPTIRTVDLG